jgi:hypothetical protein
VRIGIKATGPDGSYCRSDFGRGLVYLAVVWFLVLSFWSVYGPWCACENPRVHFVSNVTMYLSVLFLVLGLALVSGVLSGDPALPRALRLLREEPPADS